MNARRDKQKQQRAELNKQLEPQPQQDKQPTIDRRKEKFSNYLIDVSKYVLTGVVITSLFNDVSDKTIIYLIGIFVVVVSLWAGLRLTNKRKAD